jgi:hypothetical protein
MGNNELAGRRIVVMPPTADGLRGSSRDIALKNEAVVLRDAIIGALDVLDLFQSEGGIVLVANGEVRNVSSELLRWLIEASFVEKVVTRTLPGLKHEVEFRPLNPSEMAMRALLRAEPREGGLIGLLPVLNVETQGFAAPVTPVEKETASSPLPDDHPEVLASQRTTARYADAAARTELEKARGAERVAYYEGRQAPETPIVDESYPAYLPGKAEDSDPASRARG